MPSRRGSGATHIRMRVCVYLGPVTHSPLREFGGMRGMSGPQRPPVLRPRPREAHVVAVVTAVTAGRVQIIKGRGAPETAEAPSRLALRKARDRATVVTRPQISQMLARTDPGWQTQADAPVFGYRWSAPLAARVKPRWRSCCGRLRAGAPARAETANLRKSSARKSEASYRRRGDQTDSGRAGQ